MTSFSFSTGNPANLTGGANASMLDIGGSLTDVRTFLNGANLDGTNIAATYVEPAFSAYKTLLEISGSAAGAIAAGTYLFGAAGGLLSLTNTISTGGVRYLDPARGSSGTRSLKLNLAVTLLCNATAPGTTFTFGLYPVTGVGGGVSVVTATLAAVVAGSTAAFTASANNAAHNESGDFTFPAAGFYALGVVVGGTTAANNAMTWTASLDFRAI